MTTRVALAALLLANCPASIASADPDPDAPNVDAGADDRGFWGAAEEDAEPPPPAPNSVSGSGDPSGPPLSGPQIVIGSSACEGAETVAAGGDLDTAAFCAGTDLAPDALTVGDVQRAFARLDLPAATLVIQPPDGLTLVNFDTNFYTTSTQPVVRQVTLLGQRITIEATPAEYQWQFGDGQSLASTKPGAAYPALTITHNYELKGTYRPQLDTVYTGRYRVGAGPWQQIPGTVTIAGTAQQLRAIEAQPKLVGY